MSLDEIIDAAHIDDVTQALAEIREMKARLDALEVKRSEVIAAIDASDELDGTLHEAAGINRKIKEHLKNAL